MVLVVVVAVFESLLSAPPLHAPIMASSSTMTIAAMPASL
ncbi:hypothetical protein KEK_08062 [Mycolicibacterium thermoresistibile ATCC 19527]|uniref:Uncharacterized protein n=1 Tax=Mycolicibacterium thermoresistibile (strain ATCC 19527 / DSM 44167 / CIP 105390 / JCM 6362 / NCTC 10409 / 316) TaxID=1078020 RepID=G7CF41_MYCT3|nr:hypothetical protein KEK_08062 [Mycolicibacterium thermoresistibile ATCC 19527]